LQQSDLVPPNGGGYINNRHVSNDAVRWLDEPPQRLSAVRWAGLQEPLCVVLLTSIEDYRRYSVAETDSLNHRSLKSLNSHLDANCVLQTICSWNDMAKNDLEAASGPTPDKVGRRRRHQSDENPPYCESPCQPIGCHWPEDTQNPARDRRGEQSPMRDDRSVPWDS
jgi:hypothetical protein